MNNFLKAARLAREAAAMMSAHANLDGLRRFARLFELGGCTAAAADFDKMADTMRNSDATEPLEHAASAFCQAVDREFLIAMTARQGIPAADWLEECAKTLDAHHASLAAAAPTPGSADAASSEKPLRHLCEDFASLVRGPGEGGPTHATASAAERPGDGVHPGTGRPSPFGTF